MSAETLGAQPDHVVVPYTYSARLDRGHVTASRLSTIAFDAAIEHAFDLEEAGHEPRLLIASEQSWSVNDTTTAEALVRDHSRPLYGLEIETLRHPNRLLNTMYQTEAIADHLLGQNPDAVTAICWGFHAPRVAASLGWVGLGHARVLTVDAILDDLHERSPLFKKEFGDRFDIDVNWEDIKKHVLPEFERREVPTRLVHRIGKGKLLKFISQFTQRGRYDDISRDGRPIREATH